MVLFIVLYITAFPRDVLSFSLLIDTIECFSKYSGLKMNHEKTEVVSLSDMKLNPRQLGVEAISSIVKILGVHFTYDFQQFYQKNFESIEKALKEYLKGWAWRGLT